MTIHGIFDATLSDDHLNAYTGTHPGTVLVIPGGGYEHLSPRESEPVANALQKRGNDIRASRCISWGFLPAHTSRSV